MKATYWLGALVAVISAIVVAYISAGAYNVAADVPHWTLTRTVLERVRANSIGRRSSGIEVPTLDDAALVTSGAGNYEVMCSGCHLKPGIKSTEMSRGLYPAPPNFVERPPESPAATFWVIKHGIKMTGMPAWGKSMEDRYIWGLVAFLENLAGMPADRYRELVAASGGHRHGGSESGTDPEGPNHAHDPVGKSNTHEHESNPGADDHSKAAPHQH